MNKTIQQTIDDANVTGKLLEYCPPRPKAMLDDAEYLVWLYECVCLNVSLGIGSAEHCGDYGALRRGIANLVRDALKRKQEGRIVAIMGGGDWSDASVEHLVVPSNMDIDQAYNNYKVDIYQPDARWVSFAEWLMQHGARDTIDEVLEFWEI